AVHAIELALEFAGTRRGFRLTFLDELSLEGTKLGLGGSAAASVLAARAALMAQEVTLPDEGVMALASASHFLEQGSQGSSADVAACAVRGVVEARVTRSFLRPPRELVAEPPLEVRRVELPPGLRLSLAFTGNAADSRKLVAEVL